jgi:hypothetical protein
MAEASRLYKSLVTKHGLRTLDVGSLRRALSKGSLSPSLADELQRWIEGAVQSLNLLKRLAQLSTQTFITNVLNGPEENLRLLKYLHASATGHGGVTYWTAILTYFKNHGSKVSKTTNPAAQLFMEQFGMNEAFLLRGLYSLVDTPLPTGAVIALAEELDTEFAGQVIGRLELLAAKVLELQPEARAEIEALDRLPCPIQKWSRLNGMLSRSERFAFPLSGPSDSFIRLSESDLMDMLKNIHKQSKKRKKPQKRSSIKKLKTIAGSSTAMGDLESAAAEEEVDPLQDWFQSSSTGPRNSLKSKGETIVELFGLKKQRGFKNRFGLLGDQTSDDTKNIVGVSIITNGVELKVLFIDPTKKKERSRAGKSKGLLAGAEAIRHDKVKKLSDEMDTVAEDHLKDYWVVGMDIGETFAAGICASNDLTDRSLRTLSIKSKAINEPSRRFGSYLKKQKTEEIRTWEQSLEIQPEETLLDYLIRYIPLYMNLRSFYGSKKFKKAKWDMKKAQRAEYDRGVNSILAMVDQDDRQRGDDKNIVFALGNAEFDSKKTAHKSFEQYFVTKVRSLGYKVLYVNEYLTSQMAPCCGRKTESFGLRVKYCRHCHKFYHRDILAAQNMVSIARSILIGGTRPPYLTKQNTSNLASSQQSHN